MNVYEQKQKQIPKALKHVLSSWTRQTRWQCPYHIFEMRASASVLEKSIWTFLKPLNINNAMS